MAQENDAQAPREEAARSKWWSPMSASATGVVEDTDANPTE
jgi:hypothetical protein